MSFTGKAAGWLAGRLKGEKARKKTIDWMNKTGVGQLLGAAGDTALVGGALRGAAKGAGALKGLFAGGAASASGGGGGVVAGGDAGAPSAYDRMMGGTGSAGSAGGAAPGRMARFGSAVGRLATNPQVLAGAAGGIADVMGQRSQQALEEQRMGQQASQFQQQFDVAEEERKRQQAQANRLAAMFMSAPR